MSLGIISLMFPFSYAIGVTDRCINDLESVHTCDSDVLWWLPWCAEEQRSRTVRMKAKAAQAAAAAAAEADRQAKYEADRAAAHEVSAASASE